MPLVSAPTSGDRKSMHSCKTFKALGIQSYIQKNHTLHFCDQVMEIKTVSARPRWENHLHCPSLHLHGHRHGHLHQVLFNLHCKLFKNQRPMWIYPWFERIFSKGVKRCLEEKTRPPMPLFVSTRKPHSPKPLNYEETHGRRYFHIESQNALIYYEHVLAKLYHRHSFLFIFFF